MSRFGWAMLMMIVAVMPATMTQANVSRAEADCRQAQAMLGDTNWSKLIEVRSATRRSGRGGWSWAVAFEFKDRLWLYRPEIGTGSLSVRGGRLDADKADLREVLAAFDAAFLDYRVASAEAAVEKVSRDRPAPLRNGCFIESLVAVRTKLASGELITEANLLLMYAKVGSQLMGHTGLVYSTPAGRYFWDPAEPNRRREIELPASAQPLELALDVATRDMRLRLSKARLIAVPTELPSAMLAARYPAPARTDSSEPHAKGVAAM